MTFIELTRRQLTVNSLRHENEKVMLNMMTQLQLFQYSKVNGDLAEILSLVCNVIFSTECDDQLAFEVFPLFVDIII